MDACTQNQNADVVPASEVLMEPCEAHHREAVATQQHKPPAQDKDLRL